MARGNGERALAFAHGGLFPGLAADLSAPGQCRDFPEVGLLINVGPYPDGAAV